jgi:alpha-D-xyloside xylohydrolase
MNRKYLILALTLLTAPLMSGWSQTFQKTDLGVKATVQSTQIEVQVFGPSVVRVVKYPAGKSLDKVSLSVTKKPEKTAFTVSQEGAVVRVRTQKGNVLLNTQTGTLAFTSSSNTPLIGEKAAGQFVDFNDAGSKTYTVTQRFSLDKEEDIYGLGQQQRGKMSQRNARINMVQGNTDDYVPFFVSTKGYGLFWDNYSPTLFEDKPDGTLFKSDVGDCIDYYVLFGQSIDGSVACMRDLTGQAPMFPLWTFGFWQSKERYKSQNELVGVVNKYRELGVPLDGIIQDWQYWGNNYLWNAMDFLNPEFPNPQKMVDDIHRQNAHLIISIWNSFGPMTRQYREMDPQHMLLDFQTWPQSGLDKWPPDMNYPSGVKPYDPYNPEARNIYWKYLNSGLFTLGIDGWWMDSSEPDHLSFKATDFDLKTYLGSFRKVRNAFPLMTVGGVADHQRQTSSAKRVFILTRSAFAGQQRYGANTWSGDVNSSWQSLRSQIPAGLNFTLSGIPYWNSDIGGFFASTYNRNTGEGSGAKNPLYQELYVRWLQFGAFTPMMRSHGTDVPREIYNFGKKGEPIYDAIEKTIQLRYALLPYIYSTAWAVTNQQSSFMRALAMDFNDKQVRDMNDEYLFGKSILVAPVVKAQYTPETVVRTNEQTGWDKKDDKEGNNASRVDFTQSKTSKVYLPAGTTWFDFWTGETLKGGQEITTSTRIDRIPLFLRAGSILPLGPKVQYAAEKKWDQLEIRVYAGANGSFALYEDEGDNYNYEKGVYSTIVFKWDDAKKKLTIGDRSGSFPGMLTQRTFHVVLVGNGVGVGAEATSGSAKAVSYSGKKVSVSF